MARYLCDAFDEVTKQCVQWSEYVPLIPDLSQEQILTIWFWFAFAECCAWAGKKLVRMWGL